MPWSPVTASSASGRQVLGDQRGQPVDLGELQPPRQASPDRAGGRACRGRRGSRSRAARPGPVDRGDHLGGQVAERERAAEPPAAQRRPGQPGAAELPLGHHRAPSTPAAAARSNAVGIGWICLGRQLLAQVDGVAAAVRGPVQAVQQLAGPARKRIPTMPCAPGGSPVPSEARLIEVLDGNPAVSGPASGRRGQERRVGGVRAQQLGAEPVDEQQRDRADRRSPARGGSGAGAECASSAASTAGHAPRPASAARSVAARDLVQAGWARSRSRNAGLPETRPDGSAVMHRAAECRRGTGEGPPPADARSRLDRRPACWTAGRCCSAARRRGCCTWPRPRGRWSPRDGSFTVADPTSAALARRLLDAGIAHPVDGPAAAAPERRRRDRRGAGARTAPTALARLLAALPAGLRRASSSTTARPTRRAVRAVARAAGARGAAPPGAARARPPPATPGWPRPHAAGRLPRLRRGAASRAGSTRCWPRSPIRRSGWPRRGSSRCRRSPAGWAATRRCAPRWTSGPDPALVVPRSRVAYVPSAALVVRRAAVGAGFDERMHVAEDVDLVLRLHAAGWRLRYEPAARVAHDHRTRPAAWWLRKAYYGTGAAPLAAAPPRRGAADGAQPVGGGDRRAAAAGPAARGAGRGGGRRGGRPSGWPGRLGRVRRPRATAARLVGLGAVGAAGADRGRGDPALLAAVAAGRAAVPAGPAHGAGGRRWSRGSSTGGATGARDPRVRPGPARPPAGPPARRPRLRRRACGGGRGRTARRSRCGRSAWRAGRSERPGRRDRRAASRPQG